MTLLPVSVESAHALIVIPWRVLPEMRFPSPAPLPPMVLSVTPRRYTPVPFGIATLPVASTPM